MSGALHGAALLADVDPGEKYLVEAKQTRSGKLVLQNDWLKKIKAEAASQNRKPLLHAAIALDEGQYERWVSMPEEDWMSLLKEHKDLEEENAFLHTEIQKGQNVAGEHEETNGSRVGYTVKELLSNLNDKIDRIESKLDNKVDRTELEVITSKIIVLETKIATSEALKLQSDQLGQIYLKQWESMQTDVQILKTGQATTVAVQRDKDNWKILWIPIIANAIAVLALIWFTIVK